MTKTNSLEQSASIPKQAEVSLPAAGHDRIWFKARAAKSAAHCLILCIVFNFWINSEHARALIAQSSASPAGSRFTSDRGFMNGRAFTSGRTANLPAPNALFSGGGNGILQNLGVALFVSGLSPYMPQDSARQPGLPDQCASVRESGEWKGAGEQRRFPFYLEFLAGVLLCGFIFWGDAVWMGRR